MKPDSEIQIRRMEMSDLHEVAKLHAECFPSARSTRLGMPFLKKMYEWYVVYQPGLSFVAVRQNAVIGFVVGTKGRESHKRRFRFAFWQAVLGALLHPGIFFSIDIAAAWKTYLRGFSSIKQVMPPPMPGKPAHQKVSLDSIAVRPAARHANIGTALITGFEEAAIQHNASFLTLGVEADNTAARKFYERCGWRVLREDKTQNDAHYIKDIPEKRTR